MTARAPALIALGLACVGRADEPAARIENAQLRVTLTVTPSHAQWALRTYARAGGEWTETTRIGFGGMMATAALRDEYRTRFQTYYPLGKAMPTEIQTERTRLGNTLRFRLAHEDLWLDVRIGLLRDLPMLFVEAPAASRPELLPEGSVRFHEPVYHLLADSHEGPLFRREWNARDFRERGLTVRCATYMAVWGTATAVVPIVIWPSGDRARRAHWPRGGLTAVHLRPPYVLAFDAEPYPRTAHSVQHRAIGLAGVIDRIQSETERTGERK